MRYEGVTFYEENVMKMSREAFVSRHVKILWPDLKESDRKKMLNTVYDLIVKPEKKKPEE